MLLLNVHIFVASAWVGVVGCEAVMELMARDAAAQRFVARIHQWIDILIEIPLVLTIVVTGAILLARSWPPSPLLMVKVGAAMIGVIANVICIPFVQARVRAGRDEVVAAWTRKIALTGLGVPFILIALAIGLCGAA